MRYNRTICALGIDVFPLALTALEPKETAYSDWLMKKVNLNSRLYIETRVRVENNYKIGQINNNELNVRT